MSPSFNNMHPLLRFSFWCLALALFAVALVGSHTFFPFIGVKAYWFRLWVSVAAAAFLWWYGFLAPQDETRERFRRLFSSPLTWAVTAFVGAFLISTALAHDSSIAFWSNFERGEGGFAMLYFYAFFLLLGLVVRPSSPQVVPVTDSRYGLTPSWRALFLVSVAAALLVVGYGVLAALDFGSSIGPVGISGVLGQRFAGSLGNPIYVGSYLLFVFFYLGVLYEYQISNSKYKIAKKCGFLALAMFFLLFFFLSQGRGAIVGLAAGILAGLLFAAVYTGGRVRHLIIGSLAALLISGGALRYYQDSPAVIAVPIISRIAHISPLSSPSRLYAWRSAVEGWRERPLFGWGPENFITVFNRNFDVRHFTPGVPSDTWYDRAHSIVFDYLAETGAVGFLSFLSIFAVFFWQFFKYWDRKRLLEGALCFALPVAYLVQGIAVFDIFPIYIQLFLFLGYAGYEFSSKAPNYKPQIKNKSE